MKRTGLFVIVLAVLLLITVYPFASHEVASAIAGSNSPSTSPSAKTSLSEQLSPAACTPGELDAYLSSKGSPLAGTGDTHASAGQQYNVDPRLVIAIAGAESSFGKNGSCATQRHNAWGYGGGWPNCWTFASWEDGIQQVTWQLWNYIYQRGLTNIHSIGQRWCSSGCTYWESNVRTFYAQQGGNPDTNDLSYNGACGGSGGDSTPPDGDYSSPQNGATITSRTVRLAAWARDDNSGVKEVHFNAKWGGSWHGLNVDTSEPYEYNWDLCNSGVPDGDIELGLEIRDNAGNVFDLHTKHANPHITKHYDCSPPPPSCNPDADHAVLYSETSFHGNCVALGVGDYPNPSYLDPVGNDHTRSLKVGENVNATLYENDNYDGRHSDFGPSEVADLHDSEVSYDTSSVKVRRRSQPSPSIPTLRSPANGATITLGTTVVLDWDSSANAIEYAAEFWGGDLSGIQNSGKHTNTEWNVGQLSQGTYYWHVEAYNDSGSPPWSGWSSQRSFSIVPPAPSADFDAWPQSGQAPLTVSMHIVSTANISSCSWDYGDGHTGTSCSAYHDHAYTSPGSYNVRLTVSGPGGSDTKVRNNYINVSSPPPQCNPSADQVALYANTSYGGNCVTLNVGSYPNPAYFSPLGNDDAESIRVGGNVQAILYEHTNYQGHSEVFTSNDSDLSNNTIGANVVSSIEVQPHGAGGDTYEPDNTSAQANWIYGSSPQTHSIAPVTDVDWAKFSLSGQAGVVLETSGASGDTRMWLYDSSLNALEYDDDDGSGTFSLIDRLCGTDSLMAGTYYVKVDEYGNNDEIASYNLTLTISSCSQSIGVPSNLRSQPTGPHSIHLAWSPSSGQVQGYRIWRTFAGLPWQNIGNTGPSATSYDDISGLGCGVEAFYVAQAYNTAGSSPMSHYAYATTQGCWPNSNPSDVAPMHFNGQFQGSHSVRLTWQDHSSNEERFKIIRTTWGNMWYEAGRVSANITTFVDDEVPCGYTFYYRVRAERPSDGSVSNWVTTHASAPDCTGGPKLDSPRPLTVTPLSASSLRLQWQDTDQGQTGYQIQRATYGSAWQLFNVLGGSVTSYTNTGLVCNTRYYYRVRSVRQNDGAFSEWSNFAQASTTSCASIAGKTPAGSKELLQEKEENPSRMLYLPLYGP